MVAPSVRADGICRVGRAVFVPELQPDISAKTRDMGRGELRVCGSRRNMAHHLLPHRSIFDTARRRVKASGRTGSQVATRSTSRGTCFCWAFVDIPSSGRPN